MASLLRAVEAVAQAEQNTMAQVAVITEPAALERTLGKAMRISAGERTSTVCKRRRPERRPLRRLARVRRRHPPARRHRFRSPSRRRPRPTSPTHSMAGGGSGADDRHDHGASWRRSGRSVRCLAITCGRVSSDRRERPRRPCAKRAGGRDVGRLECLRRGGRATGGRCGRRPGAGDARTHRRPEREALRHGAGARRRHRRAARRRGARRRRRCSRARCRIQRGKRASRQRCGQHHGAVRPDDVLFDGVVTEKMVEPGNMAAPEAADARGRRAASGLTSAWTSRGLDRLHQAPPCRSRRSKGMRTARRPSVARG